jgi:hypothetical protein
MVYPWLVVGGLQSCGDRSGQAPRFVRGASSSEGLVPFTHPSAGRSGDWDMLWSWPDLDGSVLPRLAF